ncbi:hypothetical protein ACFQVA_31085 [Actinomadura keratinilytica]
MSTAGIVRYWTRWMELTEEEREFGDPEEEGEPSWHPRWIPWAESEGDAQILDGREGPGFGRLGMKYYDEEGLFGDDAPSLAAYLTEVADVLENGGRSVGGCRIWRSAGCCGGPRLPPPRPAAGEPRSPCHCSHRSSSQVAVSGSMPWARAAASTSRRNQVARPGRTAS